MLNYSTEKKYQAEQKHRGEQSFRDTALFLTFLNVLWKYIEHILEQLN